MPCLSQCLKIRISHIELPMYGTPREIWKQAPENQSSQGKKQQEQRVHWPDLVCTPRRLGLGAGPCRVPGVRPPIPSAWWVCMHLNSASVSSHLCPVSITSARSGLSHHCSPPGEPFSFLPSRTITQERQQAHRSVHTAASLLEPVSP